ncbi:hydrolase [Clostridium felsineum]|uniref:YiiX/YebB-like N1pC/P60 family cysteine hydrolase n=1 Tax=Clostridium felsineum TaxID=36839 RepID=UPI00214D9145|nr:YiiX/YebB-like N1pC/P60 family cysteine hydrolase [Clostridium felsineum]MCR3758871.1 hydrolase [Clostridium felsineum]
MMNLKKNTAMLAAAIVLATTVNGVKTFASINSNTALTSNQKKVLQQYQGRVDKAYNSFDDKKDSKVTNDYKSDKKVLKVQRFSGDTEDYGDYPTRKGVILVTRDSNTLGVHYGHAGIIWSASTTVESMPNGVGRYPNEWKTRYNSIKGLTTKNTTADQDAAAADWCSDQIGKPYNYNFFNINTRDKFYCSQLVWASYKDLYGMDIDPKRTIPSVIIPVDLPKQDTLDTIYARWQD